jgi:hypothetical protein
MPTKKTTLDRPGHSALMRWMGDHVFYPHDYCCLIWPFGRSTGGYATFGRNGRQLYVHRFMCEQMHGPAPEGHQAAHSCGRGHDGCVNPRHLSWKTASDNQMDRARHGTKHQGRKAKLTREQAEQILAAKGIELPHVTAKRFSVTESNVRQIQTGKIWRSLERQPA